MSYEQRDGSTDLSDRVSKLYSAISIACAAKKSFDELASDFVCYFSDEINRPAVQYTPKELEKIAFPYNSENPYCPDEKKLTRGQLISFGFKESDGVYYWCCVNMFEEVHDAFSRVWVDTFFGNTNYRSWWYSEIATELTLYDSTMDEVPVEFDVGDFGSTDSLLEDPTFLIEDRPSRRVIYDKQHINGEEE